ncbi:hypothetical protein [Candidatus Viridilinea mediisalina]|uniref:N-acetyltransferase domain-containing protein n=1 Tax=Candidatus Viridilinea mediisalina TaxID=2024553 RepID=A0A2A6RK42_9CHLR|nr:hypothetical protein [Candidatus Viridilinea mediisalina]PDW03291.1 hypothetical protein CJ255_09600 [Candidatus Viridilinea mediisalina]
MHFTFEHATPADDAALRRLLVANPLPGRVALSYEREPSYFAGCSTMGHFWQVMVARAHPGAEVVGLANRAVRHAYLAGRVAPLGYLGQLRVDGPFRGLGLLERAYHMLRKVHNDGRAGCYLTTIVEGNTAAQRVLVTHPPATAPRLYPHSRLVSLALVARRYPPLRLPRVELVWDGRERLAQIADFLAHYGPRRQFFPAYSATDLAGSPLTRGFDPRDFCLALHHGAIIGLLGLWDQSAYKQTVVRGYHGWMRPTRPLYNLAARLLGLQPLPAPGAQLRHCYASFLCIADDQPQVFAALLQAALQRAALRGANYLMLGLTHRDPLLPYAQRYLHIPYYSRVYLAAWQTKEIPDDAYDQRIPAIEIASL